MLTDDRQHIGIHRWCISRAQEISAQDKSCRQFHFLLAILVARNARLQQVYLASLNTENWAFCPNFPSQSLCLL